MWVIQGLSIVHKISIPTFYASECVIVEEASKLVVFRVQSHGHVDNFGLGRQEPTDLMGPMKWTRSSSRRGLNNCSDEFWMQSCDLHRLSLGERTEKEGDNVQLRLV